MHYQIHDILNYCCITNINLSIKDKNNCRYKNLRMFLFENYLLKNVENKNDHKLALTHTHYGRSLGSQQPRGQNFQISAPPTRTITITTIAGTPFDSTSP